MPGLVPGIHVFAERKKDVDGRDKPGHDEIRTLTVSEHRAAMHLESSGSIEQQRLD